MKYDVRLERSNGTPIAVVRIRASRQELSHVVPAACGKVWQAVQQQRIHGAGRHVAIYLDEEINLEVGVELKTPFPEYDEVVASSIPVGPVATTTHYGPYGQLLEAHNAIHVCCQNSGWELAGPNWEIYGHWQDEWNSEPTKIRTDLYYLLRANESS